VRRDRFGLVPEPDKSRRAQRASHKRDKSRWPDRDQENKNDPNQALLAIGASAPQPKRQRSAETRGHES
jgi:hypothetical protein